MIKPFDGSWLLKGEFNQGEFVEGYKEFSTSQFSYKGGVKGDKFHGKGTYEDKENAETYEGGFSEGERHGEGLIQPIDRSIEIQVEYVHGERIKALGKKCED